MAQPIAKAQAAPDTISVGGNSILVPSTDEAITQIRPTLGIQVSEPEPGIPGVTVDSFKAHSLADDSGMEVGDRVYSVNGVATRSVGELAAEIAKYKAGEQVKLRIGRGNRLSDIRVALVDHPSVLAVRQKESAVASKPPIDAPYLPGSQVSAKNASSRTTPDFLNPQSAQSPTSPGSDGIALGVSVLDVSGQRGVMVTEVSPASPAKKAGLTVGDRIVSIDGRMVANSAALAREVTSRAEGDSLSLQIVRSNQLVTSNVKLTNEPATGVDSSVLSSNENKSDSTEPEKKTSMFGSMLGGLFGTTTPAESKEPAGDAKDASDIDSQQQSTEGSGAAVSPVVTDVQQAGFASDEMAFGDEEPIRETIFDTKPVAASIPEQKLGDEPAENAAQETENAEVSKLQSEIDRLKAQLEKAKSNQ